MRLYILFGGVHYEDNSLMQTGVNPGNKIHIPISQYLITDVDGIGNILVDTGMPPEVIGCSDPDEDVFTATPKNLEPCLQYYAKKRLQKYYDASVWCREITPFMKKENTIGPSPTP